MHCKKHTNRLQATHLPILYLSILAGCIDGGAKAKQQNIQQVITWAQKIGFESRTGAVQSQTGNVNSPLGLNWINQGKEIPGIEVILIELLEENDSRLHPALTLHALGFVGTKKCIPTLVKYTENDELAFHAICALNELGLKECVIPLSEVLWLDGNQKTMRYYAIEGLGKAGGQEAIDELEDYLTDLHDIESCIRDALAKAKMRMENSIEIKE